MKKENISDWCEAIFSRVGLGTQFWKTRRIRAIERKENLDFNGHIFQNELGFNSNEGNDYTPSDDWILSLCKDRIFSSDSIIDLGCGKGYAMYLMSRFPFKKIYGIEKSDKLAEIAKNNIKKMNDKNRFEIWNMDATELKKNTDVWNKLGNCNYVYIYNSFPYDVMKMVLEEFSEKIKESNWNPVIWYIHPSQECVDMFSSHEFFKLEKRSFKSGGFWRVYEFVRK